MSSLKPSPELSKLIRIEAKKELGRRSFWEFCKLLAPEFYQESYHHLKTLCSTLEALYRGRIVKDQESDKDWRIVDIADPYHVICKKLMINLPPQHGKSRTLFLFCCWVFGLNPSEKIITASYNNDTASDFSRFTRDGIMMQKNYPDHIVYSDVFPRTRIKRGYSGFEKWALEGQHFSYLGAGIGGSVTSKGATIRIVDDPIKGAEEAYSQNYLDKLWLWYTSTFSTRNAAKGGEPIEIMNHTRWSTEDPCGRILQDEVTARDWYVLKMEVYDQEKDQMLCPDLMSKKAYLKIKRLMDPVIFDANYHQTPVDEDKMFNQKELNYFIPSDLEMISTHDPLAYIDVADQGTDFVSMPMSRNKGTRVYIPSVVFMRNDSKDTAYELCAEKLKLHKPQYCRVEANSMGHLMSRELQKKLSLTQVLPITNDTNKHTRILMVAWFIRKYFWFVHPDYQDDQYRQFMQNLFKYNNEGKVDHDDAPDSLSGLAIMIQSFLTQYYQ